MRRIHINLDDNIYRALVAIAQAETVKASKQVPVSEILRGILIGERPPLQTK